MSIWRVIITDSELPTGVAPVCPRQAEPDGPHDQLEYGWSSVLDAQGVYDCCPHPHIECFTEAAAPPIAAALTHAEAEVCS